MFDIGIIGGSGYTVVSSWYGTIPAGAYIAILTAVVLAAYFIGNISPSTIIAKANGIDIKSEGSGNAGTTNALRVLGKKAGAITLVVDAMKGTLAVLIGGLFGGCIGEVLCAVAVFIGHVWPVIYRFRGGKGVATVFGAALGLNPLLALSVLAVVAAVVFATKRMSAGSIAGAISFPFLALWLEPFFFWPGLVIALLVIYNHRANIIRLCKGEEPVMSIFAKNGDDKKNAGEFPEDRDER